MTEILNINTHNFQPLVIFVAKTFYAIKAFTRHLTICRIFWPTPSRTEYTNEMSLTEKWNSLFIHSFFACFSNPILVKFFCVAKWVNSFLHLATEVSTIDMKHSKFLVTKLCLFCLKSLFKKRFVKTSHVDRNDMIISLKSVLTNSL